ncbi:hypothetical protein DVH05_027118 [Phytophthora capsici]|nr:hypothetical protein DVH05_027118 [Phytophthora capsici]
MEKHRAEMSVVNADDEEAVCSTVNSLMSPSAVGKVDTRSISRIAAELELEKKLRLLQLRLPARNVSTKFRALRCVVAGGYEHNDAVIQGYVKNYCRDERLRRIHRNADQGQVVRFHKFNNGEAEHGSSRKRRRANSKTVNGSAGEGQDSLLDSETGFKTMCRDLGTEEETREQGSPPHNEISYKIRRFVSQQKSGIHNQQFKKLGFAYGVMYRCKVFHRFLWNALHVNGSDIQLPGDGNDGSIQDLNETGDVDNDISNQAQVSLPGIVFSRESVLHSMPVQLYIQIFSGGEILTDAEFAIVEEAIAHQRTFDAIPEELCKKIWSHESERTAKVLGTLADLGLVLPHKIGMKHLVQILRAGYTDGQDGVLSRALKDNTLGGLFLFNQQVRIVLNENDGTDHPHFLLLPLYLSLRP